MSQYTSFGLLTARENHCETEQLCCCVWFADVNIDRGNPHQHWIKVICNALGLPLLHGICSNFSVPCTTPMAGKIACHWGCARRLLSSLVTILTWPFHGCNPWSQNDPPNSQNTDSSEMSAKIKVCEPHFQTARCAGLLFVKSWVYWSRIHGLVWFQALKSLD